MIWSIESNGGQILDISSILLMLDWKHTTDRNTQHISTFLLSWFDFPQFIPTKFLINNSVWEMFKCLIWLLILSLLLLLSHLSNFMMMMMMSIHQLVLWFGYFFLRKIIKLNQFNKRHIIFDGNSNLWICLKKNIFINLILLLLSAFCFSK